MSRKYAVNADEAEWTVLKDALLAHREELMNQTNVDDAPPEAEAQLTALAGLIQRVFR